MKSPKYSASILAQKDGLVWHSSILLNTASHHEAQELAEETILKVYPTKEGYHSHHTVVQFAAIISSPDQKLTLK